MVRFLIILGVLQQINDHFYKIILKRQETKRLFILV